MLALNRQRRGDLRLFAVDALDDLACRHELIDTLKNALRRRPANIEAKRCTKHFEALKASLALSFDPDR